LLGIYASSGIDALLGPSVIKLSDKKVKALKPQTKDYRVNDDNGLSCLITPSGKKIWRFRWFGREKMLSMGELPHAQAFDGLCTCASQAPDPERAELPRALGDQLDAGVRAPG
jgi:hypothetical protein